MLRPFAQVDVFGRSPYTGNALAVVLGADGLSTAQMQEVASWASVAETTFVLSATDPGADYQVRIFTPFAELPFAGHPTLGTAHAWLSQSGSAYRPVVQQCQAGLVPLSVNDGRLAFAAPPLVRSGPLDEAATAHLASFFGLGPDEVLQAQLVDNGPGWAALLLSSAEAVLAAKPGLIDCCVGLVGLYPDGAGDAAYEVRAFTPGYSGAPVEDPVTGSLNASLAQWLLASGRLQAPYVASQGGEVGRAGRVEISREDDTILVGGATVTCVRGSVEL